ncbi:MAG: integral rane protein TerC family protein [Firmicutes bacterium]|nr:integral rane protein TerC family protein [Bacillota bacterium]
MDFGTILGSVIVVNILLSGDNALVIALASHRLPTRQKQAAVFWGSVGAVVMRILLTIVAVYLLRLPYLQLAGGFLLWWISLKLVAEGKLGEKNQVKAAPKLWEVIKTILVADVVMSADNVLAIAGVAKGNLLIIILGLALSIPVVIWGSKLVGSLLERWPVIILFGAAFLGWTGGDMVIADAAARPYVALYPVFTWAVSALFAAIVLLVGLLQENRYFVPHK